MSSPDSKWVPFSQRSNPDEYTALVEGIPTWLLTSVMTWVRWAIDPLDDPLGMLQRIRSMERRLRIEGLPSTRNASSLRDEFEDVIGRDQELLVDVLDLLLHNVGPGSRFATALDALLKEGGSALAVIDSGEGKAGLGYRVEETIQAAAEKTMAREDRASEHLRRSWASLYGRNPNPQDAYNEAVKAIEAAIKPVIAPKNDKATLGTMIPDVRAKPEKWVAALDNASGGVGVEVLADLMDLVWKGHLRHGDKDAPVEATPAEGHMAVHVAVLVLELFESGAVTPA